MNAYEARLAVARRAFQAGAPSEVEVEAGVRRAMKSLARTRRRDPARRIVTVGAVALAFSAALAWGASGGFETRPAASGSGKRAAELRSGVGQLGAARKHALHTLRQRVPVTSDDLPTLSAPLLDSERAPEEIPATLPNAIAPPGAASAPKSATGVGSGTGASSSASGGKAGAQRADGSKSEAARSAPSWSDVGSALERGDDDAARRALRALARRGEDPNTRAKAQLGLAQLSIAQGDCRKARALALAVARTPGLAEKVVARAHDLMLRCESE